MLAIVKRYWATLVGGLVITIFVAFSVLYIGAGTVGSLIDTAMKAKGESFARLLVSPDGNLDALLTGVARDPDAESKVRAVAGLANIDSFSIFDRRGQAVFLSRSDRYEWLLRNRPGGIHADDHLASSILDRPGFWQIVNDDGRSNPSVIIPLIRNGSTIGYVSVVADMMNDRLAYSRAMTRASLSLLFALGFLTGIPVLFYVRRHRKIVEADDRIHFLANHDPLTLLFNRTRLQEETERILATSRATREEMAFCFIDIDGLSEINDSLGYAQGDELLRVVARRLIAVVDEGDVLARIGADDFALLHRRVTRPDQLWGLAKRLKNAVGEPIELNGQIIRPKISIGAARMPRDGRTHGELVKHAELALFHQKEIKTGDLTVFEPHMDEEVHRRREIEARVRQAVETGAFTLFYQPIVSGNGADLLGFEALIRMPDGAGGYVSPAVFIPIAESRGYIKQIGTWVIQEAARQLALWPDHLFVAVNLSAVQFRDGDLLDIVKSALETAGVEGRRLEIEVVESLLLERSADILGQLNALKALGVSIDMDDFGTGYSSLGYLWRFPFDKLKIDQSFMVAFEAGEPNVREILATIVSLAHLMRMKVTAEGVETAAQAELLSALGCDQLQGYRFGKPMPADALVGEFLNRFRDRHDLQQLSASPADDETGGQSNVA